ncbi:MAG: hypothetical protein HZC42_01680 [Candidatus Eisenbacteria bacterium]|nr:hypothetical protein [Candidatus Eisenbacteria bacterium]
MNPLQSCFVLKSLVILQVAAVAAGTVSSPQTETLWRGAFEGDSLYVRASWIPTAGSSSCFAFMGGNLLDSTEVRPKYLDYRIEDARARMLIRDEVSGEDFGVCVDGLFVQSASWRDGLVVTITANGWGCEPAGDCDLKRHIYIPRAGQIARSEWTAMSWDATSAGLIDGEVDDGCLTYFMTLGPEVEDSTIVFAPTFSSEVREGDVQERPVSDDVSDRCRRWGAARKPMRVDLFSAPNGGSPTQKLVRAEDRIEIVSVAVRADRVASGALRPVIFLVGVDLNGLRAFMSRPTLRKLGFELL